MTSPNQDNRDLLEFADAVTAGRNPRPTNELERTYLHVQRTLQAGQSAPPPYLKQNTWEEIMDTVMLAPARPHRHRHSALRSSWRALSAAAALIVIVASFGTWYLRDGGSNALPPDAQQYAAIAPVSGERLHLQTPANRFACDFSRDMPIVAANGHEPIVGTFLYYEPGGDLTLRCDAEPADIVLASNVRSASPVLGVPGMVIVEILAEGTTNQVDHSEYLNVLTGQTFIAGYPTSDPGFFQSASGSVDGDRVKFTMNGDYRLVALDTTTMTPIVIEDFFGDQAPDSFTVNTTESGDGTMVALLMMQPRNEIDLLQKSMSAADLGTPGDVLLMNMDTGETTWLTVPGADAGIVQIRLSPDGSVLAVFIANPDKPVSWESYVVTINTADGSVIAQSGYFEPFNFELAWTDAGLVLGADHELWLMPADGGDVQTIYSFASAGTELTGLNNTLDPNTVVVQSVACDGECRLREASVGVTVVNAETGENKRHMGQDMAYMSWVDTTSLMIMMDPAIPFPEPDTATVIDPLTGETVATFTDVPGMGMSSANQRPSMGAHSADVSADNQVRIVAVTVQNIIELRADGTTSSARILPVPGRWADFPDSLGTAILFVSPDGTMLSLSVEGDEGQGRFLLDLSDPDAEWAELSSGSGYTFFVMGIPAE